MTQLIHATSTDKMLDIVEGLVKRGLTFVVFESEKYVGQYEIKLLGGF